MSKIYLVREYGGQWEDKWEQIIKAYRSKADAENYKSNKEFEKERLLSYRDLWEEINVVMDDSTPEEDWNNTTMWDDDSETFINYLKKWHPEYLVKYELHLLKEIFDFYQNYTYWDESYYDINEIELE